MVGYNLTPTGYLGTVAYQCYSLARCLVIALCAIVSSVHSAKASFYFDPSLLSSGETGLQAADLSKIVSGDAQDGSYLVDIYINNVQVAEKNLSFKKDMRGVMVPGLTPEMLNDWGVNVASLDSFKHIPMHSTLGPIDQLIPHATVKLNFSQLRLNIGIPQVSMKATSAGEIDPSLFDEGINAFMLNYTLSGNTLWSDTSARQSSDFIGLHSGLNVSAWRLRNDATYIKNTRDSNTATQRWTLLNTYLERDIPPLKGELIFGDSQSSSEIFESMPLRGIQLVSNEAMFQTSQNGFVPVITGVANSNATVRVYQHGQAIYQTNVASGPFKLTDIASTGSSGDLLITITESNGSQHSFRQPYSVLPIMQRAGHAKYEVILGQYRGDDGSLDGKGPLFSMGTLTYGLPHDVTLYTGVLVSPVYQSFLIGSGLSLGGMGAISMDLSFLQREPPELQARQRGERYRIQFAKSVLDTNTTLNASLSEEVISPSSPFEGEKKIYDAVNSESFTFLKKRRRNWRVSLSQSLGKWGAIALSGQQYENIYDDTNNKSLSLNYSMGYADVNFYVNYSIDRRCDTGSAFSERQISFDIQIPLDFFSASSLLNNQYTSYHVSNDNAEHPSQQMGINGSFLDNSISYNMMQSTGLNENSSLYATYNSRNYQIQTGYHSDSSSHNLTYGMSGGVLIHPEGVTFSQTLGDTVALIEAKGASAVRVTGNNIYTNSHGYAVIPYLSSYRGNTISLDPRSLPDDVNIMDMSKTVYPTTGAVIMEKYKVDRGKKILMTLIHTDTPVPFGAIASSSGDNTTGNMVGDNGVVYLAGMPDAGEVKVTWGEDNKQQCLAKYSLLQKNKPLKDGINNVGSVQQLTVACR